VYQEKLLLSSHTSVLRHSGTHCHLALDQLLSTFRHILRTELSDSINPIDDRRSSAKNNTKSLYKYVRRFCVGFSRWSFIFYWADTVREF